MRPRERASAICKYGGRVLLVRMKDPKSGEVHLFPPGGAIEARETPAQAACRETQEETGYQVRPLPLRQAIARYPFIWSGEEFAVTTHFVAVELAEPFREPGLVADAAYLLSTEWVLECEIETVLSFNLSIQQAVASVLREMASL